VRHVIIGNGPAGVVAAETLRKLDPASAIVLVGDEPEPPYSRMALPYLMTGKIGEAGTHLRKDPGHFAAQRIELVRGRVERVDTVARSVAFATGLPSMSYDRLLIATGARPVQPPVAGLELPGVRYCWTMADARHLLGDLRQGARVLQLGAGFIGCIVMEALVERGAKLTIVEMGDRMVPRMMTPTAGAMIRDWCVAKGVDVRLSTRVSALKATRNGIEAELASGDRVEADLVIVSAGVRPNVEFLEGSGVACRTGIVVDGSMRSSVAEVFAAGDCAEAIDLATGEHAISAVQPSAVDQARVAAANMAGRDVVSRGSLTFNVLDTLGLISSSFGRWTGVPGGEGVELVDPAAWRYLSLQFEGDRMIGATSIGLTEHVGALRGLIETGLRLGPWKDRLLAEPLRFPEAYLARAQAAA
jgi:NADPH-dependent 2,4-dienoyl-CoA reductase/sulfur reductase-like enzyme